jgi:hypothetical protein
MTFDFPTALIVAVFASQILVMSFIAPRIYSRAVKSSQQRHPPQEYPKLYPIAPETLTRQNRFLGILHLVIGSTGAAVLVVSLARGTNARDLAGSMLLVYLAQLLPPLLRLPLQLKLLRAMRAMPAPAVRSAELRHWRVVDFIPRLLIGLGLAASALALACTAYFLLRPSPVQYQLLLFSLVINGYLMLRMLFVLLRPIAIPRPDPYMSADDLFQSRRTRLRILFGGAVFMGVYAAFMQLYAAGLVRLDFLYICAGVSILCQLLILRVVQLAQRALAGRDLTAYRA